MLYCIWYLQVIRTLSTTHLGLGSILIVARLSYSPNGQVTATHTAIIQPPILQSPPPPPPTNHQPPTTNHQPQPTQSQLMPVKIHNKKKLKLKVQARPAASLEERETSHPSRRSLNHYHHILTIHKIHLKHNIPESWLSEGGEKEHNNNSEE